MSIPNVAILIPVLLKGGTEVQTAHLARALAGAGYSVSVCCYFEADAEAVQAFEEAGASVDLLGLGSVESRRSVLGMMSVTRPLLRYLRQLRPQVVHVQYIAPGLLSVAVARLAGVRTVFATVHQPASAYGVRERWMLRFAASLCRKFFCVSRAVEESWFGDSAVFGQESGGPPRRHCTIYNAVDTATSKHAGSPTLPQALIRELRLEHRKVVTVVGRLRWEKGHATLIEAMREVVKRVPEATLLVVGEGPDREALTQHVRTAGLAGRTVWAGARPTAELPAFYAVSTVVAVPSVFEGFGLVAAEAMAAGRPVVTSDTGGLREVVEDGVTGLLVPPRDADALAAALVRVLGDPALAADMAQRGQDRVKAHFSFERFARQMSAAYRVAGVLEATKASI